MASTATTRLRLERQGFGDNSDSWGTVLNAVLDRIDEAIAGATTVSTTGGTTTLTDEDYIEDESRKAILLVSGTLASNSTIVIPALTKIYAVSNATSGSFTVTVKTSAGTGVVVPQGTQSFVLCDATDCFLVGVSGPASSTDNRVPRFDGTSGQVLQGSGIGIDDSDNVTGVGNIALSGTVDGRDVATDGTKLDGIESGATADQSAAEILASLVTVDGTGSGLDADLLDGNEASAFGDVSGPASATDGNLASFDGTTGKLIQDSSIAAANVLVDGDIGVAVQAYDAQLDEWSGIDPSANGASLVSAANYAAMRTLLDLEAGTDFYSISAADAAFEAADADILKADVGDTLTAGFLSDSYSGGTISSGTYTPAPATGQENFQHIVNGGAFTLAPPANNCCIIVQITNNASAGAITTSGFTGVFGDAFTTTDGDDFICTIIKINGFSSLTVQDVS
jgi:hypothetical protein